MEEQIETFKSQFRKLDKRISLCTVMVIISITHLIWNIVRGVNE